MRTPWWLVLLVACGSKRDAATSASGAGSGTAAVESGSNAHGSDAGVAAAPPIPAPPFELPAPTDAIVDLADDCVTRKSGHVDCWTDGPPRRIDGVTAALAWRDNGHIHCAIQRTGITCQPDRADAADKPPAFAGVTDALDIALGYPACVLHRSGKLTCWDRDKAAAEAVPRVADAIAIVHNDMLTCAVRKTGAVTCTEQISSAYPWRQVKGLDHVKVFTLGSGGAENGDFYSHGCAIHDDGTLRCYELDGHEEGPIRARAPDAEEAPHPPTAPFRGATQLVLKDATLTGLVGGKVVVFDGKDARVLPQLADATTITDHCALRAQGSVVCWGTGGLGQPRRESSDRPLPVAGIADVVSIASGNASGWAVTRDGRVHRWGGDRTGWAVPFEPLTEIARVAHGDAGRDSPPCFLRKDAGVACLSYAEPNVPVDMKLAHVVQLAADGDDFIALRADGTAVHWSTRAPTSPPTPIAGVTAAVEARGGEDLVCARDAAGTVQCASHAPVADAGVTDAVELAVHRNTACARTTAGTVLCWGANDGGELGRAPSNPDPKPAPVPGITGAIALSGGHTGFCAALGDGSLSCWGRDRSGPERVLPPGSITGPFVGAADGCTIRNDGLAACWGTNTGGRLGDGSVIRLDTPAAVPGL